MAADPGSAFCVRAAIWPVDAALLREVRTQVFVVEQQVPEELEWDGVDGDCLHVLADDATGTPIGCGRLLPDGHIGRMAVLARWRGRGVGAALLVHLVERARARGDQRVLLNAQTHAMPFYARFGFTAFGEEFDEAGIAHRAMERLLR